MKIRTALLGALAGAGALAAMAVPAWQLALSLVLMVLSIYGMVWVATRIYRVGILMYGKRPTLPEILRWLKYS